MCIYVVKKYGLNSDVKAVGAIILTKNEITNSTTVGIKSFMFFPLLFNGTDSFLDFPILKIRLSF